VLIIATLLIISPKRIVLRTLQRASHQTKAALNQLTKNLAVEWAADGIRTNAVCPWYTATPLANQVGAAAARVHPLCCCHSSSCAADGQASSV
jgi:NAD(P)-dependent dehydrogenase (short-subunit alcohol dehydrogenase family)